MIEYNIRTILLEKSYAKSDGETSPKTFSEKIQSWAYSRSTVLSVIKFALIVCPSWGLPKYIEN